MLTTDPMAPFYGGASAALRREQNRADADRFAVLIEDKVRTALCC
jgi:hypothetical protein